MNKTKNVSKRAKIIILILFEFYVISTRIAEYIVESGRSVVTEKPDNYNTLLVIFISLSLFYVILAWFMERFLKYYAAHAKRESRLFTSDAWRLILTYVFIYCPTLFGSMLRDMGLPNSKFVYFVGTTIVMALIWGIYDLRKSPAPDSVQ